MASGQTTTSGKRTSEEEEKANCEINALYRIFDSDGLDEEFFAHLQSQAPEDQKLRGDLMDLADVAEEEEEEEEEATRPLARKYPSSSLPRRGRQKRKVASSRPQKPTTARTSKRDMRENNSENGGRSKRGGSNFGSLTDDSVSESDLTTPYESISPSPPYTSPYFAASRSTDNETPTTESPTPRGSRCMRPTTDNTPSAEPVSTSNGINHESLLHTIIPTLNGQSLDSTVRNNIGTDIYKFARNKGLDTNAAELASTFLSELLGTSIGMVGNRDDEVKSVNGISSSNGTGFDRTFKADLNSVSKPGKLTSEILVERETVRVQNDRKRRPMDHSLEAYSQKRTKASSNEAPPSNSGRESQVPPPWEVNMKRFSNSDGRGHNSRFHSNLSSQTFWTAGPFITTTRRQDPFRNGYVSSRGIEYGEGNLLSEHSSAVYRRNERAETFGSDDGRVGFRQRGAYQTGSPTRSENHMDLIGQRPFSVFAARQIQPEPIRQHPSLNAVAQELSPPVSNRKSVENEGGSLNQNPRPPIRFPTEPIQLRTPDQLHSPKPILSRAHRREPLKSQEEVFSQVRAMSEVTPSKPRLSTPGTPAPTGEHNLETSQSTSSWRSLENDIKYSSSRSAVSSKYFAKASASATIPSHSNPIENGMRTALEPQLTPPHLQYATPESMDSQTDSQEPVRGHMRATSTGTPAPNPPDESGNRRTFQTRTTRRRPANPRSRARAIKHVSKYFPISKAAAGSCLPFPGTRRKFFGLVQETLAQNPFQLLVATIFLNRTKGHVAIPMLKKLLQMYPTIESLAGADAGEIEDIMRPLGLQRQRASKIVSLANIWLKDPPVKGKRYRKLDYPAPRSGRDIKPNECLDDTDPRSAWEIAHLPGIGPYAIDSWRIFCRDELRGLSPDSQDSEATEEFVPEWKTVRPADKELRAYLTWMWLKEGYSWDMETGETKLADPALRDAVSKNKAYITEDGLELSLEPRGAVVENLRSPTPPPGLKEEISPLSLLDFEAES